MKKLFVTILMLALLAVPSMAWAANVPVYLEGERVAAGLERGGYTYLPLRTMFETVGAEVEWREAEQQIVATFADGGVLTMKLNDNYADSQYRYKMGDNEYDNPDSLYMEQPPFISRGVTYVPLRFVTESALGYEVDWRDGAVYITQPRLEYTQGEDKYTLNTATGELWLNGNLVTDKAKASGYAGYHAQHIYKFEVRRTPAGSYLLEGEGSSRGFMTYDLHWSCWISADGSAGLTDCQTSLVGYRLAGIASSEGQVWLNGYSHNFRIDEASGEISQVDTQAWAKQVTNDEYASGDIRWTNGRLILLGDAGGYVLYDMQSQTGQEITPLLLTDAVKAEAEAFLQANSYLKMENMEDYYWGFLGSMENPSPKLDFVSEESGKLNFELNCAYYTSDGNIKYQAFPVSYALQ